MIGARVMLAACGRGAHETCGILHLTPQGLRVACNCPCHGTCRRGQVLSGECILWEDHTGPCQDRRGNTTATDARIMVAL